MRKKLPAKVKEGDVFGRWTVLSVERVGQYNRATCICECGKSKSVRQDTLLNGQSTSCGCFAHELTSQRSSTKGGQTMHPLYQRWYDLNRRCFDSKRKDFHHYGGRGITVCDEWSKDNPQGFTNFLVDMQDSYVDGLEIDRVDNNGNYCKANCKWSTRSEQVINRREVDGLCFTTRFLEDGEDVLHLAAMAKKYNMSPNKLQDRISKLGWSLEDAISRPHKVKSYTIVVDGVNYKVDEIFVTNISNRCKPLKVTTGQLLRSLFKECVQVIAKVNGNIEDVQYDDLVIDTKPFIIKSDMFVDCFKDNYNVTVKYDQTL